MKIFLTGASGFVGRNIIADRKFQNYEIFKPTRSELDLTDFNQVNKYIQSTQPDLIIHAAALVGGILKHQNQHFNFLSENLKIDQNMILAAFENKISHFVQIGSSCMYPVLDSQTLKEEQILQGAFESTNEGYALAKVAALKLCEYISRENLNFKYVTLIPCNLYGPFDHFNDEKSHLVAALFRKMKEAQKNNLSQIEVWGDGTARREFLYVADFVEALFQVVQAFQLNKHVPQRLNIGLGRDYSVLEYYDQVARLFDLRCVYQFDLNKPTGVNRKLLNISEARQFGWQPRFTLEEGLQKTYQYFVTQKDDL